MKDTDSSYSHILKYTSAFGGVEGLNILIGLVRNKLVALILGPEGMGLVALFNSTIKLIADATNFGIPTSAVKDISETHISGQEHFQQKTIIVVRSLSLLTAVLGTLLCVCLSPLLNSLTFTWGNHTLHYVLLSPIVAMMAISGGEIAILKGTRQLAKLAKIQIFTVISALFISVPIYYYYGQSGIVPSLVLMSVASMFITISYSYKLYPIKVNFSKNILLRGNDMLKLGFTLVIVGILGSGSDFVIRSYINNTSSLEMVGLYNAGYMITMTYAGMAFSAMATDYYPRLSTVRDDISQLNLIVNRQIEVSFLLISPMLVLLTMSLPILLPLLYSGKFLPVIGMTRILIIAMYFRAIKLPIIYISLSKGDSKAYLFLESVYDIVVVFVVILGFYYGKLVGVGYAFVIMSIFEFVMLLVFTRFRYHYRMSQSVVKYALMQIPIGIVAYFATYVNALWLYITIGIVLVLISAVISLYILHQKTHLWDSLKRKFVGH